MKSRALLVKGVVPESGTPSVATYRGGVLGIVQIWLGETPSIISMRKEFRDQEGGTGQTLCLEPLPDMSIQCKSRDAAPAGCRTPYSPDPISLKGSPQGFSCICDLASRKVVYATAA